jgi:hypothetical protein
MAAGIAGDFTGTSVIAPGEVAEKIERHWTEIPRFA